MEPVEPSNFFAGLGIVVVIVFILFAIILFVASLLLPLFVWGIYSRVGRQNRDMKRALRVLGDIKKQLEATGLAKPSPKLPGAKTKSAAARSSVLPAIKPPPSVRDEMDEFDEFDEVDEVDEMDDVDDLGDGVDEVEEEGFECESCNYIGSEEDFMTPAGPVCPSCGQD